MAYETITYAECNRRLSKEGVLQSLPAYTIQVQMRKMGSTIVAYVPVLENFPVDVSYLEQRLREQWAEVTIILVTEVPDTHVMLVGLR